MTVDVPVSHDPEGAALQTRTPSADSPQTPAQTHEATLRRAASAARVAKYFKHRWPDRAAGDFSNEESRAARHRIQPSALPVVPIGLSGTQARSKDACAIVEALHAAENEGWKPLAPLTRVLKKTAAPSRRAGVRRSVHLR